MTVPIFGTYLKSETWETYNERLKPLVSRQSIEFEGMPCGVCGKKCSQVNACMQCREWLHIGCCVDGACANGCKEQA